MKGVDFANHYKHTTERSQLAFCEPLGSVLR